MSAIGAEDVPGHWLTAAEVARASQLREDLVDRFLPAVQPPENLYSRDLVSVARFVKALTDLGTPTAAVEVAVTELRARPDAAFSVALGSGSGGGRRLPVALSARRARAWRTIGVATAAALLVGGAVAITWPRDADEQAAHPAPTETAKPIPAEAVASTGAKPGGQAVQAFAAAKPDPVCDPWQRTSAGFDRKQQAWAKTDHRLPAARWSPKQRSVTLAVVPVLREEAAELRGLADKAKDPLLTGLLRAQSRYLDSYAGKLPKFEPRDHAHWTAATAMGGAVKAVCTTTR
ncbi:hypothetical protein FR943_14720 [Mycobacterium sp. TNTM28]|uniref:Uncharacterized protein n=1 Tax=[Mycobacterium] fortunisiensis TaxID=2600579 RepID=A0ABS6KNE8_9MYCO|nr:hypothetical protein [[Mycobacterium] fortunisiensis]MBU9765091.1 hypothetical protein [[Mycobacterium] fortunisiensis]